MKLEIPVILFQVMQEGVEITMSLRGGNTVVYDLHTESKSHIYAVVQNDDSLLLELRYNEQRIVSTYDELLDVVEYSKHGRDYISGAWDVILMNRENKKG